MIADLKPYPEYRQADSRWLATLPAHWQSKRLRQVVELLVSNIDKHSKEGELPVRLCNYVDVYKNEKITERLRFMSATATKDELERFRLRNGDIIITKDSESWTDIGVPALVEYTAPDLVCGYHLAILRPRDAGLIGAFLLRALQCHSVASQFHVAANGVTRFGLSHSDIKDSLIPLPPPTEQAAIVRFLNAANNQIERATHSKRKLIGLLNEQKQVIIHRAVSHGLDSAVRLKSSGISWLGEVPEHWVTVSLRQRYHQCLGKMVDAKKVTGKHLIPYLRNLDVRWGHINTTDLPLIDIAPHERERYTVKPGDLLVCEGRHLGRSAIWKGGIEVCGFQKALHRLRPISREVDDPRFLQYVMVVANATDAFHRNKIDNAIPHLTGEMLRAHRFAFPPIHEQREIAAYLESHLQQHERAIARAEREIALLREYRTTLTADVVTGKLDVREAVKNLPTSSEQPTAPDGADVPDDTDDELTEFAE